MTERPTPEEVEALVAKARKLTAVRDLIYGGIVVVALALATYVIFDRNSESQENGKRIDALTVELDNARQLLLANSEKTKDILDCQAKFDAKLRALSFEPVASIGDLVVAISTIVPGPERVAAVAVSIQELSQHIAETRTAIADLDEWNNSPDQLPCPL